MSFHGLIIACGDKIAVKLHQLALELILIGILKSHGNQLPLHNPVDLSHSVRILLTNLSEILNALQYPLMGFNNF